MYWKGYPGLNKKVEFGCARSSTAIRMGKSIFDLTDKTGYESPWEEDWQKEEFASQTEQSSSVPNIEIISCLDAKGIPIKKPFLIKGKLLGTPTGWGGTDYNITLSCNNSNVSIQPDRAIIIEKGWKFMFEIESSKKLNCTITIKVNNVSKMTFDISFVDSKDLFEKEEVETMLQEITYIAPFADDYSPAEYSGNYCMAAAERALSKLLKDSVNFYAVERNTHKRKNKISFANKTADDRASEIKKKGYIRSTVKFSTKEFSISLNKTYEEVNGEKKDRDTTILMRNPTQVYESFRSNIRQEAGFHVYYCSIAGANHTMILVIDNRNPCDAVYHMWDQHGLSSSRGKLKNIANGANGQGGINSQVQWLVRWLRGVKKTQNAKNADTFYPKLDCNFYKIQSK